DMQAAGFNLAAIKQLLELVPAGAAKEMVRLERALLAPWATEQPEVTSAEELRRRFPAATADDIERAVELGLLSFLQGGRVRIESPTLLRAGEEVVALGVPVEETLRVTEEVRRHAEGVATAFVELFVRHVWTPFVEGGRSPGDLPRMRQALERLRPLASSSLVATFQRVMSEHVERAFGEQLERAAGEPDR
ncbi:MAG TPA: hypothetical protein VG709_05835, partial [Actinomycetota bacterium]|nr:hypothetical protein [Actinomycetota bacterium]